MAAWRLSRLSGARLQACGSSGGRRGAQPQAGRLTLAISLGGRTSSSTQPSLTMLPASLALTFITLPSRTCAHAGQGGRQAWRSRAQGQAGESSRQAQASLAQGRGLNRLEKPSTGYSGLLGLACQGCALPSQGCWVRPSKGMQQSQQERTFASTLIGRSAAGLRMPVH